MYKDLREFIELVDKLGALRRIEGADPRFEIGGITEIAAGHADGPALLFDAHQGLSARFSHLHQCDHQRRNGRRSRSASIRHCGHSTRSRPGWRNARRSSRARPLRSRRPRFCEHSLSGKRRRPRQVSGADLASPRRRCLHRLGLDRDHARSGRRLDQRLDLSRAGARPEQGDSAVRPSPAGTAPSSPRNTGTQDKPCPVAVVNGEDPGAVHRRLRISACWAIGIRVRRRHQRRADRGASPGR